MEALGFWAALKLIWTFLPEIISFLKATVVIVDGAIDYVATKKKMAEYNSAADKAKETGDTSAVEDLFRPKP